MQNYPPVNVPVALIIYNRPETTQRVFDRIAEARPSRLHLIADGPRLDDPKDFERCRQARKVVEQVKWDCVVSTDFSETNLGIKNRVSSGLDNLFSFVDRAIILEDDCLPHPSFFPFCEELLSLYLSDRRIMMIGGTNFIPQGVPSAYSYRFSIYPIIWGWATWASTWEQYDGNMLLWPEVRDAGLLAGLFPKPSQRRYWEKRLGMTYEGSLDSWAYAWVLACWLNHGLTISPNVNLVANIGFGRRATHTLGKRSPWMDMPVQEMIYPLSHPPYLLPDPQSDRTIQEKVYRENRLAPLKKFVKSGLEMKKDR